MNLTWPEFISNNENQTDLHFLKTSEIPFWICDLSDYGNIAVIGAKAAEFLQGQLTCDVREVTESQSRLGGVCDYKGRLYAIFNLFQWQNNYYLSLPKEIISNTITQLSKYAIFSKVKVQDKSDDLTTIGIGGAQAEQYLSATIKQMPQAAFECVQIDQFIIIKIPDKTPRFIIIAANADMQQLCQSLHYQATVISQQLWQLQNIKTGIPNIYQTTLNLFTPHQVNLPALNAVSFTKGCYTGQEIVARMQYLGKLKQHLYHAIIDAPKSPQPFDKIFILSNENTENEIGTVVNVALNENNQCELLAVLQDNAVDQSPFAMLDNIKIKLENIKLS
jgi:folate-binding protein YgfZ